MKKKVMALGIIILLTIVGLSGCTDNKSIDTSENDDSSFNEYYFNVDVKIDNYHSDLLVELIFITGVVDDNNFKEKSVYIPKDEHRTFDVSLEVNIDMYSVVASYYYNMNSDYPDEVEMEFIDNPNNKDMNCKIIIDEYGDISIDIT